MHVEWPLSALNMPAPQTSQVASVDTVLCTNPCPGPHVPTDTPWHGLASFVPLKDSLATHAVHDGAFDTKYHPCPGGQLDTSHAPSARGVGGVYSRTPAPLDDDAAQAAEEGNVTG